MVINTLPLIFQSTATLFSNNILFKFPTFEKIFWCVKNDIIGVLHLHAYCNSRATMTTKHYSSGGSMQCLLGFATC